MKDVHRFLVETSVWRVVLDVAFTLVAVLILMIAIDVSKRMQMSDPPSGQFMVEMTWETGRNVDMDLWVRDPEGRWVGFSSKSSPWCNLLRDDLGNVEADATFGENIEHTYCRGSKPGDHYLVNVHVYADKEGGSTVPGGPLTRPLEVRVRILWSPKFDAPKQTVLDVRFRVDTVGAEYGVAEVVMLPGGENGAPGDVEVLPAPQEGVTTDAPIPAPVLGR